MMFIILYCAIDAKLQLFILKENNWRKTKEARTEQRVSLDHLLCLAQFSTLFHHKIMRVGLHFFVNSDRGFLCKILKISIYLVFIY